MGRLYFVLFAFFTFNALSGQSNTIKWRDWADLKTLSEEDKRGKKYLVDLYTEWCGWCKRMDKTTFRDPAVVDFINRNYIAIKFDAEHKGNIEFKSHVFRYQRSILRGYHELAMALVEEMKFPTVVFLDENADLIQSIPGYQDAQSLLQIMYYFSENLHRSMPWPIYVRNYQQIINNGELIDQRTDPNVRLAGQKKN